LRTSDPNTYAAGDIACFEDAFAGRRWHAEHHLNAKWQGKQAGRNMAGAEEPFERVPYFFSDMADLHMILRGAPGEGKSIGALGEVEAGEFVELYARPDGTISMALAFSQAEPLLDAISDVLEPLLQQRAPAAALDESTFGLGLAQGLG
jgi:NADPH-dependent 2,4-dienoyl-CoA reductase/sulfur reductase-like enzyme